MVIAITSLIFVWLMGIIFILGVVSIAARSPKGWFEYTLIAGWPVLFIWFCLDWARGKL